MTFSCQNDPRRIRGAAPGLFGDPAAQEETVGPLDLGMLSDLVGLLSVEVGNCVSGFGREWKVFYVLVVLETKIGFSILKFQFQFRQVNYGFEISFWVAGVLWSDDCNAISFSIEFQSMVGQSINYSLDFKVIKLQATQSNNQSTCQFNQSIRWTQ